MVMGKKPQNNSHFRGSASFAQELSLTAIQYFSMKKTELSWEFPESLQIFSLYIYIKKCSVEK